MFPDFAPNVEYGVSGSYYVDSNILSAMSDGVFIVVENVKKHARTTDPRLRISVDQVSLGGLHRALAFSVANELGHGYDRASVGRKLDEIRRDIESGEFVDAQRREGGTGLKKLFKIVSERGGGPDDISFFIGEDQCFHVEFNLVGVALRR